MFHKSPPWAWDQHRECTSSCNPSGWDIHTHKGNLVSQIPNFGLWGKPEDLEDTHTNVGVELQTQNRKASCSNSATH